MPGKTCEVILLFAFRSHLQNNKWNCSCSSGLMESLKSMKNLKFGRAPAMCASPDIMKRMKIDQGTCGKKWTILFLSWGGGGCSKSSSSPPKKKQACIAFPNSAKKRARLFSQYGGNFVLKSIFLTLKSAFYFPFFFLLFQT